MTIFHVLDKYGEEVKDASEEAFICFSSGSTSRDLGMIDAKATELNLTIAGKDFMIQQSPSILASNRELGTTGAAIWSVTPLFAEWIASSENFLFKEGILNDESIVLELGTGISPFTATLMAPMVSRYIATDQEYALKLLRHNLHMNLSSMHSNSRSKHRTHGRSQVMLKSHAVETVALDWEKDDVTSLPQAIFINHLDSAQSSKQSIDVLIVCDCVFNEHLVRPLVSACEKICRFRRHEESSANPTLCVIAQQLRSPDVFETWMDEMLQYFQIWRIKDENLSQDLSGSSGFTIHAAALLLECGRSL